MPNEPTTQAERLAILAKDARGEYGEADDLATWGFFNLVDDVDDLAELVETILDLPAEAMFRDELLGRSDLPIRELLLADDWDHVWRRLSAIRHPDLVPVLAQTLIRSRYDKREGFRQWLSDRAVELLAEEDLPDDARQKLETLRDLLPAATGESDADRRERLFDRIIDRTADLDEKTIDFLWSDRRPEVLVPLLERATKFPPTYEGTIPVERLQRQLDLFDTELVDAIMAHRKAGVRKFVSRGFYEQSLQDDRTDDHLRRMRREIDRVRSLRGKLTQGETSDFEGAIRAIERQLA